METLGYGAHLIIDGFLADPARLSEPSLAEALLTEISALLEPRTQPKLLLEVSPGGLSGASLLAEAHLALHAFSDLNALSLSVFARRGLDPRLLTERLEAHYGVRRFESHLKNHGRTMAKEDARRLRTLQGDRQYAHARLQDQAVL